MRIIDITENLDEGVATNILTGLAMIVSTIMNSPASADQKSYDAFTKAFNNAQNQYELADIAEYLVKNKKLLTIGELKKLVSLGKQSSLKLDNSDDFSQKLQTKKQLAQRNKLILDQMIWTDIRFEFQWSGVIPDATKQKIIDNGMYDKVKKKVLASYHYKRFASRQ